MPIVFRPASADDLARAEELVAGSINDLTLRHGFGSIATSRHPDFQAFCLRDDPRGVWLAEDDGEIVGFALSWVCGRLWFLAELFVAPGRQGLGIGNELLDRTMQHASQAGATEKSLITFAFNVVSQGLYVRHGLLPRVPIHCAAPSVRHWRAMRRARRFARRLSKRRLPILKCCGRSMSPPWVFRERSITGTCSPIPGWKAFSSKMEASASATRTLPRRAM